MTTRLSSLLAIVTLIVLFGFPKAGLYVQNVPITFGYILLAGVALCELVRAAIVRRRSIEKNYVWLIALLVALTVVELFAFRIYGSKSMGSMISILVSTILMPVIMVLATQWMLRTLGIDGLLKTLRWALVPVFLFGVISFVAFNAGGTVLGIPFVTTTGEDITQVAARHNLRGPVIKMFSTYNNGNILGINLLLWGPIAAFASMRCAVAYRSICVLTLSRSVWVGLFAIEVFGAVLEKSYFRVYRAIGGIAILLLVVVIASTSIGKDPASFLLDKDLGGRVTNLQNDLEVISSQRIGWDSESLYAAAWLAFGPVGVALLVAVWMVPIVLGGNTQLQQVARLVLVVYLLIAVVEGAFTLVPTQAVYWFVAAIAMSRPELVTLSNTLQTSENRLQPRLVVPSPRGREWRGAGALARRQHGVGIGTRLMRVLLCAMAYPPDILGGGEISTRLLAEGLTENGIDVTVLTFTDGEDTREQVNGVAVHRIQCPNIYWSFHSREQPFRRKIRWHLSQAYRRTIPAAIRHAVADADPQIVHTSTIEDFGGGFWRWAKDSGYVTVHTLRSHCLLHRSANMYDAKHDRALTPDLLAGPKRQASKSVDGVVGISNDILQRHLGYHFFPNAATAVIGNPFDGEASDSRLRSDGEVRLGVLGRIEPDKGIQPLVDQLRDCPSNQPWRLWIAGSGDPSYVQSVRDRSRDLPVEFVGWTDSRPFLQQLDLLIIPSRCHEGFGRGVVEAYSVGLPVLCLRRGGLPELVIEGETGWVLDEWSAAGLADAIRGCRELTSDRMLEQAAKFSVEKITRQYIDFYETLAATH